VAVTTFTPAAHDILSFVRSNPLALVVSASGASTRTTPLPLLVETVADDTIAAFVGHFALANPQVAMLRDDPSAIILFLGPHAYIPPAAVRAPGWVPTWTYAFAQFVVAVELLPDFNRDHIETMVGAMEDDRWSTEAIGPRYASMLKRIVAFRATVVSASAKFKLGQDEDDAAFADILAWLGPGALSDMMRGQR
jgi:transcriptional regulator